MNDEGRTNEEWEWVLYDWGRRTELLRECGVLDLGMSEMRGGGACFVGVFVCIIFGILSGTVKLAHSTITN